MVTLNFLLSAKLLKLLAVNWLSLNRLFKFNACTAADIEDYVRQNADPTWLHQNEMWEHMESEEYNNDDAKEPIWWNYNLKQYQWQLVVIITK